MEQQFYVIFEAVRKYLAKNKVKIIFGTPCFGGLLHNGFFQSMLETSVNLTRLGIPFEVMTVGNESLIQRARNGIVAKFMGDDAATHLMFIDADITFSWVSIVKLLLGNKELSGGCYPKKCFNWDKIKHHIGKTPTLKDDELMAKSLDYVFNPIYHQEGANIVIRVENGMAQVKDIGTGFMMIQKSVIRKMIVKYSDLKYRNNVAGYGNEKMNDYFYSFFDCCIDPVSKVYLSEDYLFCKRWIEMGGELWLDIGTNLNHTGLIDYKGCLSMIIGEVDVLNKDAQILREQFAKDKQQSMASNGASGNAVANANANTSSKKKKKNKKKKGNIVADSGEVNNTSGDVQYKGDCVDNVDNVDESDGSEDGNCEQEHKANNLLSEQVMNGNHC